MKNNEKLKNQELVSNSAHHDEGEIVDLEVYAKQGKKPPQAKAYRIKVDSNHFIVQKSVMTGREILSIAGKAPAERFQLNQKMHKGVVKKIELDEKVDFTTPGIERFMTIPLDQTEG